MTIEKTRDSVFSSTGEDIRNLPSLDGHAPIVSMRLPKGRYSALQGWPQDDIFYLWLFQREDQVERLKDVLRGDEEGIVPLFPAGQMSGRGDAIIAPFRRGKASKGLVAVVRYIIRADQIYIDMMAVKSDWRRRGVNTAMIKTIAERFPNNRIIFSPPTEQGQRFIEAREGISRRLKP